MKRANPETGQPFKKGDVRADGYLFRSYSKTRMTASGFYKESWLSPEAYKKALSDERACGARWFLRRWSSRKEMIDRIKQERGCARCGYNEHPEALDFDHNDPSLKMFNISSRAVHASEERLLEEIRKCSVLCANCHRVRTKQERHSVNKSKPSREAA
jgi:hypothetical protein